MKKIFILIFLSGIAMAVHAMDKEHRALEQQNKDHQEILTRYNAMLIACAQPSEKNIHDLDEQFDQIRKHPNKFLTHILWEIKYENEMFSTNHQTRLKYETENNLLEKRTDILNLLEGVDDPTQKKKAQEVWRNAQQRVFEQLKVARKMTEHLRAISRTQGQDAQTVQIPEQYSNLKQKCSQMCAIASIQDDDQLTSLFKEVKEYPNQLFALLAWQQTNGDKKATKKALEIVEHFTSNIRWQREIITNFSLNDPLYDHRDRANKIYHTLVEIDKLYGQK